MAIEIGEKVFIPASKLEIASSISSMIHVEVVDRRESPSRSIKVKKTDGSWSEWIGSKLAHENIGIYIVRIGDFSTEDILLEPLTKSILQFFRLMLTDDFVKVIRVRSRNELSTFWKKDHGAHSHVILVGHGRKDSVEVGIDGWTGPSELADIFDVLGSGQKNFLSLACKTGRADFARLFSESRICQTLIAPYQTVHGAIASNLCQSYFAHHFLEGLGVKAAYNRVNKSLPGGTHFRFWSGGQLQGVNSGTTKKPMSAETATSEPSELLEARADEQRM